MNEPVFKVGDKVRCAWDGNVIKGTITDIVNSELLIDITDESRVWIPFTWKITKIVEEPPVGSVVIYDGAAYIRIGSSWRNANYSRVWEDIKDGEVIWTPNE